MGKARLVWLLAGGLSLVLVAPGCVEPPGAAHIVGPDGTKMLHVHCPGEQVACFRIAGDRCPHGYDLSPIFDPHDGNFLVRCRDPQATPVVVARTKAPAPNSSAAAAVSDRWPPTEVDTPTEPWPTHASTELPPAPRNASGTVDLGY
ncbi:MAG: hypothetical protein WDO74_04210 [Pseudomonadota bacterium]